MTHSAKLFSLNGKKGLVLGVANDHSIAWGCTKLAHELGAELLVTCLNDKAIGYVEPLTKPLGIELVACNVENPGAMETLVNQAVAQMGHIDFVIHSIEWAPLEDLDRKSTRLNSSHRCLSRMPSSA